MFSKMPLVVSIYMYVDVGLQRETDRPVGIIKGNLQWNLQDKNNKALKFLL